jgi:hypothetical protein
MNKKHRSKRNTFKKKTQIFSITLLSFNTLQVGGLLKCDVSEKIFQKKI